MPAIEKSRILIMATDGFEQSELEKPLEQLRAKGRQGGGCRAASR